jgi:hypothetical protein
MEDGGSKIEDGGSKIEDRGLRIAIFLTIAFKKLFFRAGGAGGY